MLSFEYWVQLTTVRKHGKPAVFYHFLLKDGASVELRLRYRPQCSDFFKISGKSKSINIDT